MKTAALVIASLFLVSCPAPPPASPPPPDHHQPPPPDPGDPPDDPPADRGEVVCETGADCESGICEGGCGPDEGVCAPANRACTRDLRQYCGCDGATFQSSGSCPGRRFVHRGACKGAGNGDGNGDARRPDGEACETGANCRSGLCEGQGCGDNRGVCVSPRRMCTADRRPYCGCDNQTFFGSGSCPNRRFSKRGEC